MQRRRLGRRVSTDRIAVSSFLTARDISMTRLYDKRGSRSEDSPTFTVRYE
jgi:hypothetical protein